MRAVGAVACVFAARLVDHRTVPCGFYAAWLQLRLLPHYLCASISYAVSCLAVLCAALSYSSTFVCQEVLQVEAVLDMQAAVQVEAAWQVQGTQKATELSLRLLGAPGDW